MKSSVKFLASVVGMAGLSLSISLPTLAQNSPSQNDPAPSPGSGVMNQPSGNQPGMMNQPGMSQPYQSQAPGMSSTAVSVPSMTEDMSIVSIVSESPSFRLFNSLLRLAATEEPELLANLMGDSGKYTVFAPTDRAFAALPEGTIRTLVQPENRDALVDLLSYHIVPGEVTSAEAGSVAFGSNDIDRGLTPPSGDFRPNDPTGNAIVPPGGIGDNNTTSSPGGSPSSSDTDLDQDAGSAPPSGELNPNENVGNVDRSDVIEPTEVGAEDSNNSSSPRITADRATGNVMVGNARVIGADIQANNGIIHAVDSVILPPGFQADLSSSTNSSMR